MDSELLPCPFCNAQASVEKIGRDWWPLAAEHDDNCALDGDHHLNAPQTDAGLAWLTAAWNIRIKNAQQDAPTDAPLSGKWHHGNGNLCCGSLRIGAIDVDTQPAEAVQAEILDWMCARLNAPAQDTERDRDAERYRAIRHLLESAVGGGIEVNDAKLVYEEPEPGEEIRLYWYPDTPVGFYEIKGATLDEVADAARAQRAEKEAS